MKTAFRATAILSGGTVVKVAAGLAVAKVWAVLVGPAGVGTLGLLQSLVGLVSIGAALGLSMGVVRLGAGALARGDVGEASALARAALGASALGGLAAAVAVVAFRGALGRNLLEASLGLGDAVWLAAGVIMTVVSGAQLGVLNAHQRVSSLARAAIWGSLAAGAVGVAVLWALRERGLVEAYVAGVAATCAVSSWELARASVSASQPSRATVRRAAARLIRFGLPFTASALVGTGVMLALPVLVLRVLDVEAVGQYRAALSVSAGYLGFLLAAMGQDYYPRLAAVGEDPDALGRTVNDQLRLVLLVGGPVVLLAQATAVWVVPLIYAPSFAPAAPVLEWQLAGSLFRYWAWAFSFVVLARSSSAIYFAVEAAAGSLLFVATWGGLVAFGLVGSGVGFLVAYVGYAALVWALVRRREGVRVEQGLLRLMAVTLSVSLGMLAVPAGPWRVPVCVLAAGLVSAWCAHELRRRLRGTSAHNARDASDLDWATPPEP